MIKSYFLLKKDYPAGPYSLTELKSLPIEVDDKIRFSDDNWKNASDFPELVDCFSNHSINQQSDPPPFDRKKFNAKFFDSNSHENIAPIPQKKRRNYFRTIGILCILGLIIFNVGQFIIDNRINPSPPVDILQPPPPNPIIAFKLSNHSKKFFDFLKPCNSEKNNIDEKCDYRNPAVRNYALSLIDPANEGEFNLGQVCDIYDKIRNSWIYINDPETYNYLAFASETINNGFRGDCDDYAILMAALLSSIGGEVRVTYGYNNESGHAYTEINLGKTNLDEAIAYLQWRYKDNVGEYYRKEDQEHNNWINVDWFSEPASPGGKYFEETYGTHYYILQEFCETY